MSDVLGVALMVAVGAQLAPQAPINRGLARLTAGVPAAFVSFLVGTAAIVVVCAVGGELGGVWGVWGAPPGEVVGGLLGAGFVLIALLCVGTIGAGGVAAAAVTGQLLASLALDAAGAFGLESRPLDAASLLGAAAVLAGTYMVLPRGDGSNRSARSSWRRLGIGLVVVAGGAMMGVQHPINGELGASIGDLPASVVNFVVGSTALGVAVVVSGQVPRLAGLRRARPHQLSGGLLGAVNVTAALIMVGRIGAGAVAAAGVTGQMIASLALDRAGLLALERHPVTARRLGGAALLVAGTALVAL